MSALPAFLKDDWNSDWKSVRDRLAVLVALFSFMIPSVVYFQMAQRQTANPDLAYPPVGPVLIGAFWMLIVLAELGPGLVKRW